MNHIIFFKHADNDPHAKYEGPSERELSELNEILALMNATGYTKLGGLAERELAQTFALVTMVKTPKLFKIDWLDKYPEIKRMYQEAAKKPQYAKVALREFLFRRKLLPEIPYRGAPL